MRRRRECLDCEGRFNTYESPMLNMPIVIKNDNSRESFDDFRLRKGMMRALEKRPVATEDIEQSIDHIKKQIFAIDKREIATRQIGEMVMQELKRLDHVAYIRFASVYLSFEDIQAFEDVIKRLESEPTPELRERQVPLIDDIE